MTKIISYLTFNGNCKIAMKFYQKCLGGELIFQMVGESERGKMLPESFQKFVLHGQLLNGNVEIVGTDMVGDDGLQQGNTVSMLIVCQTKKEVSQYFKRLSTGGRIVQPIKKNYWGLWFGTVQDRYGNYWLLQSA